MAQGEFESYICIGPVQMAISRQDKPRFVPRASKAKDSGLCSDIFPSRSRSFLSVMRSYTCRKVEFRRQLHVVDVGVREAEAAKPSCRCVGRRKPRETLISAGRRHFLHLQWSSTLSVFTFSCLHTSSFIVVVVGPSTSTSQVDAQKFRQRQRSATRRAGSFGETRSCSLPVRISRHSGRF